MKTFVLAGAIHKGLIQPETQVDCEGGVIHIGKRVIREADAKHQFHLLTATQILAYSMNTGMTKIAFKIGPDAVRDSFRMFGFGERSGIDLPGEAKGIIQPFPWRDHLLANISFGHGLTATPLQIANAYAVIANGGYLRRPYVVKEIRDHENSETVITQAKTLSRVLTDEDVAKIKKMLLAATSKDGTGYLARVAGYPVAGKTGTAQKVDPNGRGYLKGGYVSSFAGYIPAGNPKYVIYIAVDHPRKDYYGGAVAAPVFARVASFAVRRAGLAPSMGPEDTALPQMVPLMNLTQDSVSPTLDGSDSMPISALLEMGKKNEDSLTAGSAAAAVAAVAGTAQILPPWKALSEALDEPPSTNANVNVVSPSARVGYFAESAKCAKSAKGAESAKSNFVESQGSQANLVGTQFGLLPGPERIAVGSLLPDLTGLSLREVLTRVSGSQVDVRVHGQGFVIKSLPAAGSKMAGNRLTVYLSEPE